MDIKDLQQHIYIDEIVAYEVYNKKIIRKVKQNIGQSKIVKWGDNEETTIEVLGSISPLKYEKLKQMIKTQGLEWERSKLGELFIKGDIPIKDLEKRIKYFYYIVGKPTESKYDFWVSPQIKDKKETYEITTP